MGFEFDVEHRIDHYGNYELLVIGEKNILAFDEYLVAVLQQFESIKEPGLRNYGFYDEEPYVTRPYIVHNIPYTNTIHGIMNIFTPLCF